DLIKQRLIANLYEPVEDNDLGIRQLTEKQQVLNVKFEFFKRNYKFGNITDEQLQSELKKVITIICEKFNFQIDLLKKNKIVIEEAQLYIFHKLIKIVKTYKIYSSYLNERTKRLKLEKRLLDEYINK